MDVLKVTALGNTDKSSKLNLPFCSMNIGYVTEHRDLKTRELIHKRVVLDLNGVKAKYKSAQE
ncbi:hypothetical protein N7481_007077 [Penicillium waksmanii]|uniref:uncharacterized protein n=1 Tax=Penicillium waksmanii TaxID=69791 RepID=UPI002548F599|nr:uncharacterized protein N7481_007077 [Penicillium waksmanii]KAJ5979779.1 hypothetical protein N7481_007077 [Penicillium waksmanii]